MPQKISKSSSKCGMWTISKEGVKIVHNGNNFDGAYNKNCPTFFKAFHSVNFLLTNSQLVHSLVLFTVLSGWVPFLVLFTVLEDFLVKITLPWTISTSRGKFSYKGLDIKLAQCGLIQHIGLDFLYTTRIRWNLSFPFSFLRKIQ